MPEQVRITDVSPRDGLQNESTPIPTERKAELVRAIFDAQLDETEVSSFVSPKWIPQLGDASELFHMIAAAKPTHHCVSALVPNERGFDALLNVNQDTAQSTIGGRLIDKVSLFTAASESFTQRNTNASIDETLDRFRPVIRRAHEAGLQVRAYISCAFACPFEGLMSPDAATSVAERLVDLGVPEIDLADTIGKATPLSTDALLVEARSVLPAETLITLHYHDTFGTAIDCIKEALRKGVRSFDAALAGLGGCPYASTEDGERAPGNVDTELLIQAVEAAGFTTSASRQSLQDARAIAQSIKQEATQ